MLFDDSKYPVEIRLPYRKELTTLTPDEYEHIFRRYYLRVDAYRERHNGEWPDNKIRRTILGCLLFNLKAGRFGNKKYFFHIFRIRYVKERLKKFQAEGGTRYEYGMKLRGDPKKRANKAYELRVQEAEIRRAQRVSRKQQASG
jgi:hypothetical protein